jgi:hypothetical protein
MRHSLHFHDLGRSSHRLVLALTTLATLGCSDTPRNQSATRTGETAADPTLGPDGYGRVKIGSSLAELNAALGQTPRADYEINADCDYARPAGLPPGMSVMIAHDTVVRIDMDSAP